MRAKRQKGGISKANLIDNVTLWVNPLRAKFLNPSMRKEMWHEATLWGRMWFIYLSPPSPTWCPFQCVQFRLPPITAGMDMMPSNNRIVVLKYWEIQEGWLIYSAEIQDLFLVLYLHKNLEKSSISSGTIILQLKSMHRLQLGDNCPLQNNHYLPSNLPLLPHIH